MSIGGRIRYPTDVAHQFKKEQRGLDPCDIMLVVYSCRYHTVESIISTSHHATKELAKSINSTAPVSMADRLRHIWGQSDRKPLFAPSVFEFPKTESCSTHNDCARTLNNESNRLPVYRGLLPCVSSPLRYQSSRDSLIRTTILVVPHPMPR